MGKTVPAESVFFYSWTELLQVHPVATTSHTVRETGPLVSLFLRLYQTELGHNTDGCGFICEDALWALLVLPAFFYLSSQTFGCMEYVIHMVVVVWGGTEFKPFFFISFLYCDSED